jgi:hypothetical protein
MPKDVSTLRLYVMRFVYLLNFALLGLDVWPTLFKHQGAWDPLKGVAFSFWAALSLLSGLGLRYPMKMVPLLLLQLVYKAVWLAAVALPMWSAVWSTDLTRAMVIRGCCGCSWYPLVLRSGKLREGTWREMERARQGSSRAPLKAALRSSRRSHRYLESGPIA